MGGILSGIGWLFGMLINRPLGFILGLCYNVVNNYGLALLLFTIITRVFLFPLAIRQQRATAEMIRLSPKIAQINKKYAKDKQRLTEETMKLYQEEGYNPMGGCLPLLIQLPILYGLINVIYRPLTYIAGLTNEQIINVVNTLWEPIKAIGGSAIANVKPETLVSQGRAEIYAAVAMNNDDNFRKVASFLPANIIRLNFDFFGMNLSKIPKLDLSTGAVLILIPIFCYVTSLLSSWISMRYARVMQPPSPAGAPNMAGMNKSMLIIMPFVSAFFATTVPAGVGLYWIYTNIFMILQIYLLNLFFNPVKLAEKAELASQQRKAARLGRAPAENTEEKAAEGTERDEAGAENRRTTVEKKKSKKQLMEENRKRLSASRRAEKNRNE